jgi:hypothetical protein
MGRWVDAFSLLMLVVALASLGFAVHAVGQHDDILAVVLIALGFALLRAAVDMLRPRTAG